MAGAAIRIDTDVRDNLGRFQLRISGAVIRQMTQGEVIAVLLELGDKHFPDAIEIARKEK